MDKTLIVMVGIPGSGKSFLAQKIQAKYNAVLVSSDAIRLRINGSEESQDNPEKVWAEFYENAFSGLVNSDLVVLDATFARRRDRTLPFKILPLENVRTIALFVNVSFEKAALQNSRRERKVPNFVLETMYSRLVEFPPSTDDGFDEIIEIRHQGDESKIWNTLNL